MALLSLRSWDTENYGERFPGTERAEDGNQRMEEGALLRVIERRPDVREMLRRALEEEERAAS